MHKIFCSLVSLATFDSMKRDSLTEMLTRSLEKQGVLAVKKDYQELRQIRSYKFTPTNNHETKVSVPGGPDCILVGQWFYPVVAITRDFQPIGFKSVAEAVAALGSYLKFVAL